MDKLFKAIENITTKGASKLIDLFSVTPEEEAKGKTKATTTMEKVGSTIGDYFKPTEKVRVRDVVREVPQALSDVLGKPIIRSATAIASKLKANSTGIGGFLSVDPRAQYIPKTEFEKELTGTDKAIDFSTIGKETRMAKEGAKTIPVIDPLIGGLVAMGDVFSGGKGSQTAKGIALTAKQLKTLSKLSKVDEVTKALRGFGVEAKTAKTVAGDIAKTTKTSEVAKILGKTSKQAGKTVTSGNKAVSGEIDGVKTPKGVKELPEKVTLKEVYDSPLKLQDLNDEGGLVDYREELDYLIKKGYGNKSINEIIDSDVIPQADKGVLNYLKKNFNDELGTLSKEAQLDKYIPSLRNTGSYERKAVTDFTGASKKLGLDKENINDGTVEWVEDWVNRYDKTKNFTVPEDIQKQLGKYKPEEPVLTLYRGVKKGTPEGEFTSWTYDKKVAERFADRVKNGEGEVITKQIPRENVVVDFTRLPKNLLDKKTRLQEAEVIVKKGMQANYANLAEAIYQTPEEIKVYRGSGKGIGNSTFVNGQYFADSRKFAETFGDVSEGSIPKNAEIFDFDIIKNNPNQKLIPKELLVDPERLTEWLINRGIKYTKNTNTRGVEYVKLNKVANDLKKLAQNSESLNEFKKKVMDNYDVYRDEIKRLSENYTNADWSRMRSPIDDIWNKVSDGTKTLKEDGVRSVGDILSEKYAKGVRDVSQETPTLEKVLKPVKNERRFITRVKSMDPNLEKVLKGQKETRSTEELVKRADELIKTNMDEAINVAKTDTSDYGVAVASRLIDSKVKEAKGIKDIAKQNELWDQVAEIANESARNLTENGRAIQASTILGRMTPEGMVRFASRLIQKHNTLIDQMKNPAKKTLGNIFGTKMGKAIKKIPEITGQEIKDITNEMERINKIEDKIEKAMALQKLTDKIKSRIPSSMYDKIVTVWKAGLLTGLKTSGLNIASNTAHSVLEVAKDIPATIVDKVVSLFTGNRTLALTGKGSGKGLKEGIEKGWRYFKTGFDERDIATKLDYNKVNMGDSKFAKAIQAYEETVFKTLGTEDQPFYYTAKARSLASQAIAKAKNAGLKGTEAKAFVENLLSNPTDEMLKYATLDAETSVFQNKTTLGTLAKGMQGIPGGQIILPFAKTPSAVATQIINYSPIGIVSTIAKNIGKGKFDQRLFAQGMGRGLTGTAVLWLGTQLGKNGMISTAYPTSEKERKQWELEGKTSNSIKIGSKWRNSSILGPAGLLLVIGGHMQEGMEKTGSFTGGLAQASGGIGSTLTDQTFLRGVNQTIEAINDPNRSFNGWASSLAGSIVPTIIADIARGTDKYERRTATPVDRIQSRVPGWREGLEPKVDTFGKKIETPSFLTVMLDATRPGQPTADENDPVVKELRRLSDEGYPATPTQLGPNKGYSSLTDEQNTYLWQIAGNVVKKRIKRTMDSSSWDRMDDEQKQKELENVVSDVMVEARARVVLQALNGLSANDRKEKMKEMIKEKLLTRQVYSMYLSLNRKK